MEHDPLIGRQLGAYLIQDKLGEGGMARVYKAYDPRLQRDVAIKVILSQIVEEAGFRERFEQEIRLSAQLEHQNIVRVYDVGESGNLTYLVMQFVRGGTLRDQLRGGRPLEPRRAAHYALQMARALHHAHLRGIVHRDVKPQNMLVSATDPSQLLLSDFGIAKVFDSSREETITSLIAERMVNSQGLTSTGQIVGTAEYMAPEQANMQPVDARTDVYSLGVVLFQMLTGQVPFQSSSALGLLYHHVHTAPLFVRELNPTVPELLARITAKALAKAPAARFQSAEEMAQALEFALNPTTNPFSVAPRDDYATHLRAPSSLLPPSSQGPLTPPASSSYGPQSIPGTSATSGPAMRTTTAGSRSAVTPTPIRSRRNIPLSYIMVAIAMVALIVFGIWHPSIPIPGLGSSPGSSAPTVSTFTDDFHDNHLNWLVGAYDGGNLMASLPSGHKYVLTIANVHTTYFPHPDPAIVKPLPNTFSVMAQITQNTGDTSVFYGIAFYMSLQSDGQSMQHCYAFVIDGRGDYQLLKYDISALKVAMPLWTGSGLPAIHRGLNQSNTLQAFVKGNSFSFEVNGMVVPLGAGNQNITDSSSPYTGGQLALLVAGPNTSFTATQMRLAIPS